MHGIVGIVASETSRYTQLWADLNQMQAPDGVDIVTSYDGPLALARNALVRECLRTSAQWLLFIDDDHAVPADFLIRLMRRPVVPILGSLYLTRRPPFQPTIYGPPGLDLNGQVSFECLFLDDVPTTGVHPVYACGASGMLVQREVFEALPDPWFKLGAWDHVGEDMTFCHDAQQAGFSVHVDVESRLGHLAPFAVWPDVVDGQWATSVRRDWLAVALDPAKRLAPVTEMSVG